MPPHQRTPRISAYLAINRDPWATFFSLIVWLYLHSNFSGTGRLRKTCIMQTIIIWHRLYDVLYFSFPAFSIFLFHPCSFVLYFLVSHFPPRQVCAAFSSSAFSCLAFSASPDYLEAKSACQVRMFQFAAVLKGQRLWLLNGSSSTISVFLLKPLMGPYMWNNTKRQRQRVNECKRADQRWLSVCD